MYDLEIDIEFRKRNFDFDCSGYMKIDILLCLIDIFEEIEGIVFEEYIKIC